MTRPNTDPLVALLRALREGGTMEELVTSTGIHPRTIQRMIRDRLEPSGIEVIRPAGAGRREPGIYRLRDPRQVLRA